MDRATTIRRYSYSLAVLLFITCCLEISPALAITPILSTSGQTYILTPDGSVLWWGPANLSSPPPMQLRPAAVPGTSNFSAIYGGYALKSDGTVWILSPTGVTQVAGIANVKELADWGVFTLALKTDGTVWGWGDNQGGELGIGHASYNEPTPVQAIGLTNIISIAAGGAYDGTGLAIKSDGTVWAWGSQCFGVWGDGSGHDCFIISSCGFTPPPCTAYVTTPTQVSGLSGFARVALGSYHAVGLKTDGTVWTWGTNNPSFYNDSEFLLGIGALGDSYVPVQLPLISGIVDIKAAQTHSLALKSDGTLWAWGINSSGALGNNSIVTPTMPVQTSIANVNNIGLSSNRYSLATKTDNSVWSWGSNVNGNLGDGTTANRLAPVQVVASNGQGFLYLAAPPPMPPSSNDYFVNRSLLSGYSGRITFVNVGATKEAGEPNVGGIAGGGSIWLRWVAAQTGTLTILTTGSNFDTLLGVYTGSTVSALTQVAARTTAGNLTFNVTAGQEYQIMVDAVPGVYGSVQLSWSLVLPTPNDGKTDIPTLPQWGMLLMGLSFVGTMVWDQQKRQRKHKKR